MDNITELRLLVILPKESKPRKICKIGFTRRDASLYLFPYAPSDIYYIDQRSMNGTVFEDSFNYEISSKKSSLIPKISIHESGQVHIKAPEGKKFGELFTLPLDKWEGQHLATVSVDNFNYLKIYNKRLQTTGSRRDYCISFNPKFISGRITFYLASDRPSFVQDKCEFVITMKRPNLVSPIYLGIKCKPQDIIGDKGIVALAGWNPVNSDQTDYLFVRGE